MFSFPADTGLVPSGLVSYQPPPPPASGAPYPATAYQSYGSPGFAPQGASPLSLKGLSVALTVLFPVAAVAALIGTIAAFHRASVMSDLPQRLFTTDVQDADDAVGAGVGFFGLVALAIAVVFIIWQFRHREERRAAGRPVATRPGLGDRRLVHPARQLRAAPAAALPLRRGVRS